ncbi:protein of unknown function [Georgfuchsia toluolica]|uniref:Uncharacterized protein n=1 Tax=Georgfuchsia toluolica TaxID=424218 RepID=A0A916J1R2_9PROT|nr:protein of unknown function [Georgfuchsia toluolica]
MCLHLQAPSDAANTAKWICWKVIFQYWYLWLLALLLGVCQLYWAGLLLRTGPMQKKIPHMNAVLNPLKTHVRNSMCVIT